MHFTVLRSRIYPVAILSTTLFGSIASPVSAADLPRVQDFLVTAYYSPLPDQCCYYRGNYESEIEFNGGGIQGADQTKVYPGMIAAPASYAFGTRIELPSLGVVGTVHDRGGRIIEWNKDTDHPVHRIDLWMGYGEEGLARALSWGARSMKGKVYASATNQPEEHWSLDNFPAPISILALLPSPDSGIFANVSIGQKKYTVRLLQKALFELGYFKQTISDLFGPATKLALAQFQKDYGISGDGTQVDQKTFATLTVAKEMKKSSTTSVATGLRRGSRGQSVKDLQRLLRYLGFYMGRTNGVFDKTMSDAVKKFQLDQKVIASVNATGAGTVGPGTKAALQTVWKNKQVAQKSDLLAMKMDLAKRIETQQMPEDILSKGDNGDDVKSLQVLLANLGYFPKNMVNAQYGEKTTSAVLAYQISKKIVKSDKEKGAGNFGPATKDALLKDAVEVAWKQVRANGKML